MNRPLLMALLASALLLAACSAQPGTKDAALTGYANVTPQELSTMLDGGNVTLVDVHIPEQPHIPGTAAVIPYNDTATLLAALPDKDANIALYCRSGHMSVIAATQLVAAGYTHVLVLSGGENAWRAAGYTVKE